MVSTCLPNQKVIFPVKMTPIHKVWSLSLGGQGVILTGAAMVAHVIIVSPQSQLDLDLDCFGFGIGSKGTGLGTRAGQF